MQRYSKMVFYFFIILLVVSPAKNILAQVNEPELPNIFLADVKNRQKVESFVDAFIKVDPQANQLLNPSNVGLFKKGYRGKIGLFNDPESKGGRQALIKLI